MDDREHRQARPGNEGGDDPAEVGLGKRGYSQTGEDEGETEHGDDGQVASQLDLKDDKRGQGNG